MRDTEVQVCFRPSDREAYVLPGTRLVEAAAEAGLVLDVPCGGEGICGRCRVRVVAGAAEPTPVERERLSPEEIAAGWRLACQSVVAGPTDVVIPTAAPQILVPEQRGRESLLQSPVRKLYVELPPPSRGDDLPDVLRLERALGAGSLAIDLSLLRQIAVRLREAEFRGTAVLVDGRLLDFEPGHTETDAFAVALDLGTTTLVAELLDLAAGAAWAVEARLNPQIRFGDDVLSRILHVRQNADGLGELRATITSAVDEMIGELCRKAGAPRERVYAIAVSGNTTMQQLFCGVDPSPLGEVPFTPTLGRGVECRAEKLDIHIHPRGDAYVMPVIGGFVGGDTVAGILATGLQECEKPTLLVDIGTNGEIVLLADGRLSAASTAAGPAFEGARISCGMRGCAGAIEKVLVADGRLQINVIGDARPAGLCGSGLIDVAAELLRHGLLTPQGRLLPKDELPRDAPADLLDRVVLREGKTAFRLAAEGETADGRPIELTQRDLRELQLATGAIRAGIAILLRRAGLTPGDLDRVLVAGGFGNFIRRSNAQRIGLLPCRIERHRIRFVGNTSLAGARLAVLSRQSREKAEELARAAEHIDLSCDADFSREFAEAMMFPEE